MTRKSAGSKRDPPKGQAYLVQDLLMVWHLHRLLVSESLLFQLDALAPIVKVASHEDFVGGMRPAKRFPSASRALAHYAAASEVDARHCDLPLELIATHFSSMANRKLE